LRRGLHIEWKPARAHHLAQKNPDRMADAQAKVVQNLLGIVLELLIDAASNFG